MKLINDQRAVANVWITIIIAIFGFSLFYALTYDIVTVKIFNTFLSLASPETPQAFYDNIDRFRLLYTVLPIIFILNIIIYGFVKAQKKEYEPY